MRKQNLCIGIFYLLVPTIANIVVLAVTLSIEFPLPQNREYEIWIAFLDAHKILGNIFTSLSFVVSILLVLMKEKNL